MKHFLNLERCNCGAYRYLAVREHKKSYEVYLIHHVHSQETDSRKYSKLASIPKYLLNIHDERVNQIGERKSVNITFEQSMALKSLLREVCATNPIPDEDYVASEKPIEEIDPLTT
ncbi:MAG: hypothetical protein M1587_01960 [Thaumarchaeota archaeon]|nr:hypothetical protein [Nitrososphaerota archaeon]MCL5067976.1 hypothetical protein [Nitrososphaerota archaeon]